MLTKRRLREVLRYDSKTGKFFWRIQPGPRSDLLGKRAGKMVSNGYWSIRIDGKDYLGHRLAWLYVHGRFPSGDLDHINRDKACCRIDNLRPATRSQNLANRKIKAHTGAFWDARQKRWFSSIGHNYKQTWLGRFTSKEAAHAAYCKAAKTLHGDFVNLREE